MDGGKLVQLTAWVRNPDGYKGHIEKKDFRKRLSAGEEGRKESEILVKKGNLGVRNSVH